jgi:FAD/FMN-containing dehydrogenase
VHLPTTRLILNICVQVTIVTADGSILTVNDKLNTDLFWAVRGGGCNFGVVTEFVYQLHPQRRDVYAGMLIFPATVLDKLVSVTAEWWANGNGPSEKECMLQSMTRGPDGTVRFD